MHYSIIFLLIKLVLLTWQGREWLAYCWSMAGLSTTADALICIALIESMYDN